MKKISLEGIKNTVFLDEFHDIYASSKGVEFCSTSDKPSTIFHKIKNNYTVILTGNYVIAQAILSYIHHYEDELVCESDYEYYKSLHMDSNDASIKRIKVHRLNYVLYHNKLPFLDGCEVEEEISVWLSEDTRNHYFLLPARRYMRILTDIKRAKEGIFFDFIHATIYIAPFVYVPFDKSVPEMFLQFKNCIEGKKVVDIGTGTGILSIVAARLGAKAVTSVDINENAVRCAKKNMEANHLCDIVSEVKCSDLFDHVEGKFDTIIFNAPWVCGKPKNTYEVAIYDPGYDIITRFIEQLNEHLLENGTILLQYSDISQANGEGSIDHLSSILKKNNLWTTDKKSILRKNRLMGTMERVSIFSIKRISLNGS